MGANVQGVAERDRLRSGRTSLYDLHGQRDRAWNTVSTNTVDDAPRREWSHLRAIDPHRRQRRLHRLADLKITKSADGKILGDGQAPGLSLDQEARRQQIRAAEDRTAVRQYLQQWG